MTHFSFLMMEQTILDLMLKISFCRYHLQQLVMVLILDQSMLPYQVLQQQEECGLAQHNGLIHLLYG